MYVEYFNKPHFFLPQFYNFRVWFLSALEKFREFKLQILKDKVVKNFIQNDYKILTFETRQMVLNYETHSCNELFLKIQLLYYSSSSKVRLISKFTVNSQCLNHPPLLKAQHDLELNEF